MDSSSSVSPPSASSASSATSPGRIAALHRYDVLDTPPEDDFDHIAELAAHLFEAPTALVSFVDADRQWFKACLGFPERETSLDISFCVHAIQSEGVTLVPDATQDPRFSDNDLVTGTQHIRFYAGAPIETPDGYRLGTLCVLDTEPRETVPDAAIRHLKHLAATIAHELELRREVAMRKERESELEAAYADVNEARIEAEEARKAMNTFLAGVTHDLQTPLTRILVNADLLYRTADRADRTYRNRIQTAADRMSSMVQSLASLARVRGGKTEMKQVTLNAREVVREVYEETRASEEAQERTYRVEMPEDPVAVRGEREALVRVLMNLVENALQYTEPGDRVTLSVQPEGTNDGTGEPARVRFVVSDTGPGIPEDDVERLFQPYARGKTTTESGTGLGLAIAHGLSEAMNGTLDVESEPGNGAAFILTLPAASPEA